MNRIVEQIKGRVRVEVFGAFPESLLNASALTRPFICSTILFIS